MGLSKAAEQLEAGLDVKSTACAFEMPFMETRSARGASGAHMFNRQAPPRVMKTHLPVGMYRDLLNKYPNTKVVQTIRNPKDTLVSWFHHMQNDRNLGGFVGTWNQFFELFRQKRLPWGDYFDHTAEWYSFHQDRAHSLVLRYEDMIGDHRGHVIKIATFMGLDLSEKAIDIIVQKTTRRHMSKDYSDLFNGTSRSTWQRKSNFIRKGTVGDWVHYFSQEQSDYVDAKTKEYLEPLGLTFEYPSQCRKDLKNLGSELRSHSVEPNFSCVEEDLLNWKVTTAARG